MEFEARFAETLDAEDAEKRPARNQELRFALVMNGGVSLAVWIGGVCREFHRLARSDGAYGELLALMSNRPRIDVLSGTSAGGINGAFLAMALAHGTDLGPLRDLWIRKGGFRSLLRSPFEGDPPSLLKGDAYLLEELRGAFRQLWTDGQRPSAAECPIDLTLTTTLLSAQPTKLWDDFGTLITDVEHRGTFHFVRDLQDDPFERSGIIDQLALASRCTSSFPGAFEASYCPVGTTTESPARPDMGAQQSGRAVASFCKDTTEDTKRGAFVVDGGVLDNKPLGPALEAVFGQRSSGDVRRVIAHVVPDPGSLEELKGDDPKEIPTAGRVVLQSLVNIPRVESVRADLRAVREHNRRVHSARASRVSVTKLPDRKLDALSATLLPLYRERRLAGTVTYLVDEIGRDVSREAGHSLGQRGFNSVREALTRLLEHAGPPWIPRYAPLLAEAKAEREPATWAWGLHALEHFAMVLFDVLERSQRLAYRADDESTEGLAKCWGRTYEAFERVRAYRAHETCFWKKHVRRNADVLLGIAAKPEAHESDGGAEGAYRTWWDEVFGLWERDPVKIGDAIHDRAEAVGCSPPGTTLPKREAWGWLARQMALILNDAVEIAQELATSAVDSANRQERDGAETLAKLASFFAGPADAYAVDVEAWRARTDSILQSMLVLEVVQDVIRGHGQGTEQVVELIQIGGNAPNAFDCRREVAQKLAGIQLGHFGAFLKRSWRANDWMFGRLDAAQRIASVLLSPERLRQLYGAGCLREAAIDGSRAERVMEMLHCIAVTQAEDEGARAWLGGEWSRDGVQEELAFLDTPDSVLPEFLPVCVAALTRRLQLEIIRDEIPSIADAVSEDLEEGSDRTGPASSFLRRAQRAMPGGNGRPSALDAIDLFRDCRIGEERVVHEVGTDLFASSACHAAAVATKLATGKRSGLGWLRAPLRLISFPALALHLTVQNAVGGSRIGPSVSMFAFAAALTVLVVDVLTSAEIPGAVSVIAAAVVIAQILFLLWRRHTYVAPVVLAALCAGLLYISDHVPGWTRDVASSLDDAPDNIGEFLRWLGYALGLAGGLHVLSSVYRGAARRWRSR